MVAADKSNSEVEYARGLHPLSNSGNSAAKTPTDIRGTVVENAEDAAKQPGANHPSMKTRQSGSEATGSESQND